MQYQSNIQVVGMKRSKGDYNGQPYDSTTVYILVDLDATKGNAKGKQTESYKMSLSDNYSRFENETFPFEATGTFMVVSNGKSTKTELINLEPVKSKSTAKVQP